MKKILKALPGIVLVCSFLTATSQELQPMTGEMAPVFTLSDLQGKSYSLENFRGRYVVIHFATTWCPFCNAEAPSLAQLYLDYKDKDVMVLMIDVREEKALVEKVFNRFNFSFPVLLDPEGTVSASYAPPGIQPALARHEVPIASNLIIDKEGKILFYSLLNTAGFDAKLTAVKQKLDELTHSPK